MKEEKKKNPFPYSDNNKRYHTYDYYLRKRYGGKCVKIALDAGFTCPNIDGKCARGGCIYCSPVGSGDFAFGGLPLAEQYRRGRALLEKKWDTVRCIPYLQAHTNTYADRETLARVYREILSFPDVVAFHIATRADCLGTEVLSLLREVADKTNLTVELGLQSVHDKTAAAINRGHTFADFCRGYSALRAAVPGARISIHLINGLPQETREMMLSSVQEVALLAPDEIKLHLLHVLKGTRLAAQYLTGEYVPLSMEDYVDILTEQLALLPPEIVLGRITGDGAHDALLAPLWSKNKFAVINAIDREMERKNLWQGKKYAVCV